MQYGELPNSSHVFIDMELCDVNLEDYNKANWVVMRSTEFISYSKWAVEIWTIMKDIASGLEFIHGNNEVHRDLKPRNGSSMRLFD